jgi:hypothetical protein
MTEIFKSFQTILASTIHDHAETLATGMPFGVVSGKERGRGNCLIAVE